VGDANGYGLRVPGLVISPYAGAGLIDHLGLSFDAYEDFDFEHTPLPPLLLPTDAGP